MSSSINYNISIPIIDNNGKKENVFCKKVKESNTDWFKLMTEKDELLVVSSKENNLDLKSEDLINNMRLLFDSNFIRFIVLKNKEYIVEKFIEENKETLNIKETPKLEDKSKINYYLRYLLKDYKNCYYYDYYTLKLLQIKLVPINTVFTINRISDNYFDLSLTIKCVRIIFPNEVEDSCKDKTKWYINTPDQLLNINLLLS